MWHRSFRLPLNAALAAVSAVLLTSIGAAADDSWPIDDSAVQPTSVIFGGAAPLATTRTVPHWSGEATNPVDNVTYEFNMVGSNPAGDGSATIGVDIIPIDVNAEGLSFNGSDAVAGGLASPLFQNNDHSQ